MIDIKTEYTFLALSKRSMSVREIQQALKMENINVSIGTIINVINQKGKTRLANDLGLQKPIYKRRLPKRNSTTLKKLAEKRKNPNPRSQKITLDI